MPDVYEPLLPPKPEPDYKYTHDNAGKSIT